MEPEQDHRTVEPALNGDEPGSTEGGAIPPEPNGSEETDVTVETPPTEAVAPPYQTIEEIPEAVSPSEAAHEEPQPEPLVEAEASSVGVEPPVVVEPAAVEEPAALEEPATAEEPAQEEPSSIAADIERALQAAAAPPPAEQAAEEPAVEAAPVADVPPAVVEEPVEAEAEGEEEEAPISAFVPGDWFVVHTYAGYENKVKTNLESRISSMNVEDRIYEVVIPMEDVMEIKSGKKQVVQRKVFPGYLLVRMELDDDSWYVVRNTPGVTGFVGSGARPIPLSEKEVDRILRRKPVGERPRPKLEWAVNDPVRVTTGPFANFQGLISEIDTDRSKLKVLVNIFGRETPVELGFDQVAKV